MYIDTHCHVSLEYFNNIDDIINKAFKANVLKIIVNGYDKKSNIEALQIALKYPGVYASIGFHPNNLDDFDIEFLKKYINNVKVVAIGEIGLDYHYDDSITNKKKQIDCFKKQLDLAYKYKKPVIVHSRDSIGDTYDILKAYKMMAGSLHCYNGSIEMANNFIKLGLKIGVGGIITFKNAKNIVDVVKSIDLKHIILETDAPFITPEPYRGLANEPSYIPLIAGKIAEIKNISLDEVISSTTLTAMTTFDLSS